MLSKSFLILNGLSITKDYHSKIEKCSVYIYCDPAIFKVLTPVTLASDIILQNVNIQVSVDVAFFISLKITGKKQCVPH